MDTVQKSSLLTWDDGAAREGAGGVGGKNLPLPVFSRLLLRVSAAAMQFRRRLSERDSVREIINDA